MPGIADDVQAAVRRSGVQIPRASGRTHDIVTPLHDVNGDVRQSVHVIQDEVVRHEHPVREVVAFDARESHGELQVVGFQFRARLGNQVTGRHLPAGPFPGCSMPHRLVFGGQPSVVGAHQITSLRFRDVVAVALEGIGEDVARALLVEPRELAVAAQENAAQHEVLDTLRMVLRVNERQR